MTYKNLIPLQWDTYLHSYDKPDHYNTDYPFFTIGKGMNEILKSIDPQIFFENSNIDFRPAKTESIS